MKILVVNGGSSTFKFSLFDVKGSFSRSLMPVWTKTVELKGTQSKYKSLLLDNLEHIPRDIDIVGHRVVHGGVHMRHTMAITKNVKQEIQKLIHLAPLHNPLNLIGIEIAEQLFPIAKQVAVFDTAFFLTMPEVAWTYPIPFKWREEGIRRYGFHGISHQCCSETVCEILGYCPSRLVTCHLGNGASCTAIKDGKAIDTTMGFTPMEGVMMGTRSGTIDPGIIIYLQREKQMSVEQIDRVLNKESGLLGIAGTFDMREIVAQKKTKDQLAQLAFDMYCYRVQQAIGALASSLGGLDVVCFTGGVGENSQDVRDRIIQKLQYLGDVKTFVIPAREDWFIAKEACTK